MPSTETFLEQAGPAFEAYASGDHETALTIFMRVVGGVDWDSCRSVLDERLPGAVAQATKDAETFFGVELPALTEWVFGREEAAAIRQPVLSVLGTDTQPVWVETAEFLRSALPGRGVHDPRRGASPAHPAPQARRPSDHGIPRAPPHAGD